MCHTRAVPRNQCFWGIALALAACSDPVAIDGTPWSAPVALEGATLSLSDSASEPGAPLVVRASGFTGGVTLRFLWDELELGQARTDAGGEATFGFDVPSDARPGVHSIGASAADRSEAAAAAFTVRADYGQLGATQGRPSFNRFENVLHGQNLNQLAPIWSKSFGRGVVNTPPIVASGRVYVHTSDGKVHAYRERDGSHRWVASIPDDTGAKSALAASYGSVFVTGPRELLALKAADGSMRWRAPRVSGSPLLAYGSVFVAGEEAGLVAFDVRGCGAEVCPPLWSSSVRSRSLFQIAAGDGQVYAVLPAPAESGSDLALYAFAASGCGAAVCEPVWQFPLGDGVTSAPAFDAHRVFLPTTNGFYAFDAAHGSIAWRMNMGEPAGASPAIAYGSVFWPNFRSFLSLNERTGQLLWAHGFAPDDAGVATAVVANRIVYLRTEAGRVLAFSSDCAAENGVCAPLWETAVPGRGDVPPVVVNGRLLITAGTAITSYGIPGP